MTPVAPEIRVGPPRTPFAGGPVRTAGASGAQVTHHSAGAVATPATDIDKKPPNKDSLICMVLADGVSLRRLRLVSRLVSKLSRPKGVLA